MTVGGVPVPKPATLVRPGDDVHLVGDEHQWASRGGVKLSGALDRFQIAVEGRRALDVGASTGGFTDVLLHRGAASVAAVDVGYGQLVWRLRSDPRVTVFDRTNFRIADPNGLGAPFDVVAVDVSFISVGLLARPLAEAGRAGTDYLVLVKPQFEVGREHVGRGGVVTDPGLHADAVRRVAASLSDAGLGVHGVCRSPLPGASGNTEFFLHLRPGPGLVLDAGTLQEAVGA